MGEEVNLDDVSLGSPPSSKVNNRFKSKEAPDVVKPVPRLSRDLSALQRLFIEEHPPQ